MQKKYTILETHPFGRLPVSKSELRKNAVKRDRREVLGDEMIPLEIEWTRRILSGIKRYFSNQYYSVEAEIVDGGMIETKEGIDAVVLVGEKVFGIQTKRPYVNKTTSYHLDDKQHEVIKTRDWVYYAFPENIPRAQFKNVLHRTIFSQGKFDFTKTVHFGSIPGAVRWGEVAKGLEECETGLKIESEEDKKRMSSNLRELVEAYLAILSINLEEKHVRVSVGYEKLIDKRVFPSNGPPPKKCPRCGYPEDEFECPNCGTRWHR